MQTWNISGSSHVLAVETVRLSTWPPLDFCSAVSGQLLTALQAGEHILRTEGVRGLYHGLAPTLLRFAVCQPGCMLQRRDWSADMLPASAGTSQRRPCSSAYMKSKSSLHACTFSECVQLVPTVRSSICAAACHKIHLPCGPSAGSGRCWRARGTSHACELGSISCWEVSVAQWLPPSACPW